MRVIEKQKNRKMCLICGLDNELGVKASFYTMEDNSVYSLFRFSELHQSYPLRVHGGMISAMLDELGLRSLWALKRDDSLFGVTISLDTKYRKPVPYNTDLIATGTIIKETASFFSTASKICDVYGNVLATGTINYMKMDVSKISSGVDPHDEMPYINEDGIKEINFK